MRKLIEKTRQMSDERKGVFASSVAGFITLIVLGVWSLSFMDTVAEAEPALAAQSPAGPLSSLMDQMSALFENVDIPNIVSTSTESAPFDQAN